MEGEEKLPLINLQERIGSYSSTEDSNNGENVLVRFRNLGSRESDELSIETSRKPSNSNRITYTWSELNVFFERTSSSRLWSFRQTRENRSDLRKHHILKNVNGVAYPGEILAIMGASGAGKSTLLNALTFRTSSQLFASGLRCFNGVPANSSVLTSQSAYVQQDDLFIGCLTVKEHLIFQALVRMDKHISKEQRKNRVDEVINELGLRNCENTPIGIPGRLKGISGGEMRRLSFASEVLTDPSLMFCDEPTSGLDSFMALNVMQVLKGLAKKGKTILCTIHQPSSDLYSMFDSLLFMAEGRVAFLGTPDQADVFFSELEAPCPYNFNPADYYVQLLAVEPGREESCKQAITMICDRFDQSENGVKIALEAATVIKASAFEISSYFVNGKKNGSVIYKANWWRQFTAVLWRSWLGVTKEPLIIKVRMLQNLLIACVTSVIFFHQNYDEEGVTNINGVLYIFIINMTFQNVFAVITVFCSELPIFLRENKNGMYRTDVYFLCKTLAEMPLFTFIPVIFTGICYFLIGLNPQLPRFFITVGTLVLVVNAVISFGYLISCVSSSTTMALSLGPPLIVPFVIFGGFLLNIGSIPIYLKWFSYISWFRYGNEALLINQWKGVEINCRNNTITCPKNGHIILEMYGFSEDDFAIDLYSLLALAVGFRALAFFALLLKTYRNEQ